MTRTGRGAVRRRRRLRGPRIPIAAIPASQRREWTVRPVPTVVAEPIVVVESAATTEPASESQPPQAAEVLAGLREVTVESATVAVAKEPVVAVDPAAPSVPTAAPASIALPTEPSLPLTQEAHSRRKVVAAWVFGTVVGLLTLFGTVTTFATFLITKSLGN